MCRQIMSDGIWNRNDLHSRYYMPLEECCFPEQNIVKMTDYNGFRYNKK